VPKVWSLVYTNYNKQAGRTDRQQQAELPRYVRTDGWMNDMNGSGDVGEELPHARRWRSKAAAMRDGDDEGEAGKPSPPISRAFFLFLFLFLFVSFLSPRLERCPPMAGQWQALLSSRSLFPFHRKRRPGILFPSSFFPLRLGGILYFPQLQCRHCTNQFPHTI
jgi:hypothetical protein